MFAELISKTNYSFLEGASQPKELVTQAVKLGLRALAITDRNGVYGAPKAYLAHRQLREKGLASSFKLIIGSELTIEDHPSIVVLAKNRQAYGLLCRMITRLHADFPKGEGRLKCKELFEFLARPEAEGFFVFPRVPFLDSRFSSFQASFYGPLKEVLGKRMSLPITRMLDGRDRERTNAFLELSHHLKVPLLATNDVHFHEPSRRMLQDVLTCNREHVSLEKAGSHLFSNAENYLKSYQEIQALFSDLPHAVFRSSEIADQCHFRMSELKYRYPSEWIPKGKSAQTYLSDLVWKGAEWRYPQGVPENVKEQLLHELDLIQSLQFADFFLTIWEIVEFARQKKILCQGRGSAANSAICYCLGITAIDPVRMNLLFERFISADRGEPPDIDVDFEHERREEVIQHIYEKYGRDRAAMVSAVVTYRTKSCIRDVERALGEGKRETPVFEKLTEELRGFPRHLSIHSGGFTLSADPIVEIVPVEPARMEGRTIVQWDKYDLDTLGLLKVDVLALGMLSALRKSLNQVGMKLEEIPPDDKETYQMLHQGDTIGVFQVESRAQMNMLGRLKPVNFYDLVIEVAIVRPGPIVGKMVHPYLKRRRGIEPEVYPDERVKKILGRTRGVPLFQEQIMKLAIDLAGFTPGEADELRRNMGTWSRDGSMSEIGKKLAEGLLAAGLPQSFASDVFKQIQGFSEYGFPESHAASFALLAYASSYLKCHHPAEFFCALLNSQPMGFYSTHSLVDQVKREGVEVLPVHPNHSFWDSEVKIKEEKRQIQLGFQIVNGLGEKDCAKIIQARNLKPFQNLFDFAKRSGLKQDVLNTLAIGNAFQCFGMDRRQALWMLIEFDLLSKNGGAGQMNLFGGLSAADPGEHFQRPGFFDSIRLDYESYHLSTLGHPMQALRPIVSRVHQNFPRTRTSYAKQGYHGKWFQAAGMLILRQRPPTAKGTVFATLEDEDGLLDLIFHKKTYERFGDLLQRHSFLIANGWIQKDGSSTSLLVKRCRPVLES